ncbi:MAG: IS607 family transposase [Chlamydiia bacterium]
MKVSIREAAKTLGVHPDTLRRWEAIGRIEVERTARGHRRYDLAKLKGIKPRPETIERAIIGYARVSSHDQKGDLKRQVELLEAYAAAHGWTYEIVEDLGSGLNYNKKGLRQLIKRICSGRVQRLLLTHKDRLMRFGSELIFSLCEYFGTEVIILNAKEESSFEDDLVQDVLEIITVFSARLYGARSRKNRKLLEALKEAADGL